MSGSPTTKRGFARARELAEFSSAGTSVEVYADDDFATAVRVLVVFDPDREPTDAEVEDLAGRLYEDTRPEAEKLVGHKLHRWGEVDAGYRERWSTYARAAWKRGAR